MEMRQELEALVSKYGGNTASLAKELRKLYSGDASKRAKLETALDKVIADYGTITLTRFKKEAAKAWHRAFPDGVEKREVKGYQLFVKENMARVKEENPDKTHTERMAIIGKMWQDSKGVSPPPPAEESEPEPEPVNEEELVPLNHRGKRQRTPPTPEVEGKRRTRRG